MSELNVPQGVTLWALRTGCKGPATLGQIVKATELGYRSDGYKAVVEKALMELIQMHLVQKLIVPGTKHFGPGRTLYGLTPRGYDFHEDDDDEPA